MFQGLFKKATGGFIAIIAAAGQLANRLNLFVLDLCIRDRVTQFRAVCQHDRRRAMDIIIFLAETTFCKYRRAPLAAVEQVYEVVHIKTSLTSEVQHYFLLADIPAFGGHWGEAFLLGPGSIHVAHTPDERVPKRQLLEAVEIYQDIIRQLCKRESK